MEFWKVIIKKATKNKGCVFVKVAKNTSGVACYSFYNGFDIDTPSKTSFNKASFIQYLENRQVAKKYIKEIESI